MYLKNGPFVVENYRMSFNNGARTVVVDVTDDLGVRLRIVIPEGLMAALTGQFLKERLFGLH